MNNTYEQTYTALDPQDETRTITKPTVFTCVDTEVPGLCAARISDTADWSLTHKRSGKGMGFRNERVEWVLEAAKYAQANAPMSWDVDEEVLADQEEAGAKFVEYLNAYTPQVDPSWTLYIDTELTRMYLTPEDEVVVLVTGPKGRSSLIDMSLRSLTMLDIVNKLSPHECLAMALAVQSVPFPLGNERQVYEASYNAIERSGNMSLKRECEDGTSVGFDSLGEARAYIMYRQALGMNAPWDTYVKAAGEFAAENAGRLG